MKVQLLGNSQVIMSNEGSKHCYFAWPTVERIQNGKLAVVASGFRLRHICPFGKLVISYSDDEGETYTSPAPVIDTILDDRDGGIKAFGESSVIVTSFNNTVDFQRNYADAYSNAYLDTISPEEELQAHGAEFRISRDFGVTFGTIHKSPITSPHGPLELKDGSLLWVGRTFLRTDGPNGENDLIQAYRINEDGSMEFLGKVNKIFKDDERVLSCEPHAVLLEDGTIIAHIRVQTKRCLFTIYQTESEDGGRTWSEPRQILEDLGGAPSHLLKHSSGVLIAAYGCRGSVKHNDPPFGVKVMFSTDKGKTWDTDHVIYSNHVSSDLGYPATVELKDGTLLTVFYARQEADGPAVIMQQKWRFEM